MSAQPDRLHDEFLLVRCQLGDSDALSELVNRLDTRLRGYLARMAPWGIDDLRQEVWLQVLRSIGRLEDAGKLDAWFFTIARRVVMSRLRRRYRRRGREQRLTIDVPAASDPQPMIELDPILAELSIEEREAVTLFYLLGQSGEAVAAVQGIPEATVRSRLARARRRLADIIAKAESEEA